MKAFSDVSQKMPRCITAFFVNTISVLLCKMLFLLGICQEPYTSPSRWWPLSTLSQILLTSHLCLPTNSSPPMQWLSWVLAFVSSGFHLILCYRKSESLLMLTTDFRWETSWGVFHYHANLCGTLHFWGHQWLPLHLLQVGTWPAFHHYKPDFLSIEEHMRMH